jgi:hypothetical protein
VHVSGGGGSQRPLTPPCRSGRVQALKGGFPPPPRQREREDRRQIEREDRAGGYAGRLLPHQRIVLPGRLGRARPSP